MSFLLLVATLLPGSSEAPSVLLTPESAIPRGPGWRPEALLASRDGTEAKWLVMLSEAPGCPALGSST